MMTTLRDIEKIAKSDFIPYLEGLGFKKKGAFDFIRSRGRFWDILAPEILSSGKTLRIYATCWVGAVNPKVSIDELPRNISILTGGPVGQGFPNSGGVWDIGGEVELKKSLAGIKGVIECEVVPWFSSISTSDDFIKWVDVNAKLREAWPQRERAIRREIDGN
jgi:hypothetical protein